VNENEEQSSYGLDNSGPYQHTHVLRIAPLHGCILSVNNVGVDLVSGFGLICMALVHAHGAINLYLAMTMKVDLDKAYVKLIAECTLFT